MASRTAYSTWNPQKPTLFDDHYLRNRSTLYIGVLGYIGIVQHKEHSPEVLCIPPATPCIHTGWAKSRYRVIIFFFTGIANDGRERKYRTKKVDFTIYYIPTFGPTCIFQTKNLHIPCL